MVQNQEAGVIEYERCPYCGAPIFFTKCSEDKYNITHTPLENCIGFKSITFHNIKSNEEAMHLWNDFLIDLKHN